MSGLDDPGLTLGALVRLHAADRPDAPALVQDATTLTYRELDTVLDRLGEALANHGLAKGDRLALLTLNSIAFATIALAAARAGIIVVSINHRLAASEIAFQLADTGARVLVHDAATGVLAKSAAGEAGAIPLLDAGEPGSGTPDWPRSATRTPDVPVDADDPAAIFFTSGTTGRPKGAVLSHRNLLATNQSRRALPWDGWGPDDVCLLVMPFGHIGGFSMLIRTLFHGGCAVIVAEFEAGETLRLIDTLAVSKMAAVPAMLQRMLDHPTAATTDFSRLKVINHGAAPIEGALLDRARTVIGCGFSQGYGMTETGGAMANLDPAMHDLGLGASTGRAHPGVEIRIVGPARTPLPSDEEGEIEVRGPCVMQGYWQRPDESPIDADGWFATGDAGRLDDSGHLFISGRIKDMIVTGGENVFPIEVEEVIVTHPAVAEVAVIGVPDPAWGEAVRALVVPVPGATFDAAEIIAWTKARLARFKAPKSVLAVPALPRNALGKVLKHQLAATYGQP